MFTIGKNIFYRGRALDENLICNGCWKAQGNLTRKQIFRKMLKEREQAKRNRKRKK